MKNKREAELLAPAGSYESLVAAINAGADAVYLGGKLFGARAYAENLDTEELKKAIDFVHIHKKSLYLTVNTLLKEKEIEESLFSYIKPFYEQGLDAVIVQDLGVLSFIRENFPDLPVHASTQMTLMGTYGAKMLKEMGADRIVTARELSLSEIKQIKEEVEIEIEAFIHGALCYCYSGQCLFSSIVGGRSGNRGKCAQPCRLPYEITKQKEKAFFLSPKDLCTIEILPDILKAGVYSLKIEGRMKRPEYTAGVVSIYRKYLDRYLENPDSIYQVSKEDKDILYTIYNRGGFTQGYYKQKNGKDMMFLEGREKEQKGLLEKKENLLEDIRKQYVFTEKSILIEKKKALIGKIWAEINKPIKLELKLGQQEVQITGDIVEKANKQPLTTQNIQKQIEKTGNTPFYFENLEVVTDETGFLSITSLNKLRREAIEEITKKIMQPFRRNARREKKDFLYIQEKKEMGKELSIYVLVEKLEQWEAISEIDEVTGFYLDCNEFEEREIEKIATTKYKLYYALPPVFRKDTIEWFDKRYEKIMHSGISGFLVRNLEELAYLKEKNCKLPIRLDYSIYEFNLYAKRQIASYYPIEMAALPVELNAKELTQIAGDTSELFVYGYLPMMLTAQCTKKTIEGCQQKKELLFLKDRYGNQLPVQNYCKFCYNRIYNCKPLSLLTVKKQAEDIRIGGIRLDFTIETGKEAAKITKKFIEVYKQEKVCNEEEKDFTRGHFKRGIE